MKSNLGLLKAWRQGKPGAQYPAGCRLDGHMVQGHVDLTATCTEVIEAEGSWYYTFAYEPAGRGAYHRGKGIGFGKRGKSHCG